jgi:HAD superfamily hydrolase (TIGR01459 family)
MRRPDALRGLAELAPRYDALLCDIWGVIHDGVTAWSDACEALARWRVEVGPVILISNSPRPGPEVARQLDQLGAPRAAWSAIVTSGDVTRTLLAARAPGPAWRIGPARDDALYEGLGLEFAPLDKATFIACSGPDDDEVETPDDYRERLVAARARDLEMVCANPDLVVQRGSRLIYCGGALAALYESLGGRVLMAGKPHPPIYRLARAEADAAAARPLKAARILAIGDGLATDLKGAMAAGLEALYVGSGIDGGVLFRPDGTLDADQAEQRFAEAGVVARYALRALIW